MNRDAVLETFGSVTLADIEPGDYITAAHLKILPSVCEEFIDLKNVLVTGVNVSGRVLHVAYEDGLHLAVEAEAGAHCYVESLAAAQTIALAATIRDSSPVLALEAADISEMAVGDDVQVEGQDVRTDTTMDVRGTVMAVEPTTEEIAGSVTVADEDGHQHVVVTDGEEDIHRVSGGPVQERVTQVPRAEELIQSYSRELNEHPETRRIACAQIRPGDRVIDGQQWFNVMRTKQLSPESVEMSPDSGVAEQNWRTRSISRVRTGDMMGYEGQILNVEEVQPQSDGTVLVSGMKELEGVLEPSALRLWKQESVQVRQPLCAVERAGVVGALEPAKVSDLQPGDLLQTSHDVLVVVIDVKENFESSGKTRVYFQMMAEGRTNPMFYDHVPGHELNRYQKHQILQIQQVLGESTLRTAVAEVAPEPMYMGLEDSGLDFRL
ncbi:hypothetical protein [Rothia amarae]|uniref:hypothetical protein n=1 Tax=Rothia amarae TaxID=169480 RepID=UPI001243D7C5